MGARELAGARVHSHARTGGEAGAVHLAPVPLSRDTAGGPTGVGRRGGRWRIKLSVVYDGPGLFVVNCCVRSKAILGQCTEHGWIIVLVTLPGIIFLPC
jgi:hypothetical protein